MADVIAGGANAAAYKYYKRQEDQDLHNASVAIMLREMQREVNTDAHLEADFKLIILLIIILPSFAQQAISIDASCLFSHGQNHPNPESWENSGATRESEHRVTRKDNMLTVRTQKGMDALLWEATRKVFSDPVNVHDLMVAPQDYDVHQSGRVLELENRDLWIRTTDLSRHLESLSCDSFVRCPSEIAVESHSRSWKPETKPRSRIISEQSRLPIGAQPRWKQSSCELY